MKFEKMFYSDKEIGLFCKSDNVFYFFGNARLKRDDLPIIFPQLQFFEVKQVHGKKVVPASANLREADGHWTDDISKALLIQTADCIPILLHQGDRVAALHSGWRGTLADILSEGLKLFDTAKPVSIACGPHIQPTSFEVEERIAQQFATVFDNPEGFEIPMESGMGRQPGKTFLDLKKVLQWQLQRSAYRASEIYLSDIDTVADPTYNSYRRSRKLQPNSAFNGRNYSFVARLPR